MRKRSAYLTGLALMCIVICCYAGINVKSGNFPAHKKTVVLKKETFDCPIISGGSITSATCDNKDGSITGVQVSASTDKTQYKWRDATGFLVGTSLDLTSVPAGTYTLEVTDNSLCPDGVKSSPITIDGKNKVTITGTPSVQGSTACINTGYIKGLTVTGATSYVWRNLDSGTSYPTPTPDITNIPQGRYVLTASNQSCSANSSTFYVQPPYQLPNYAGVTITQPTACTNNGVISMSFTRPINAPPIHWVFVKDNMPIDRGVFVTGAPSSALTFSGLGAGVYQLSVSGDDLSCPTQITPNYTINDSKPTIWPDSSQYFPDRCNQHVGAIFPFITGLPSSGKFGFKWTDLQTGQVISKDKLLSRVAAGKYQFDIYVSDACVAPSAVFTLVNDQPPIPKPKVPASIICLPGRVFIYATPGAADDSAGVFKLYASAIDTIPLATSNTGAFSRIIDETTDFYVSLAHKDCESERTKVTETVLASLKIPNSFTPNNDGVNDTWVITGLDKFPGAEIRLFDRGGQQVFYSVNNNVLFDGNYKGKLLPIGVYYYVIDVKEQRCFGQISGTLTLLR